MVKEDDHAISNSPVQQVHWRAVEIFFIYRKDIMHAVPPASSPSIDSLTKNDLEEHRRREGVRDHPELLQIGIQSAHCRWERFLLRICEVVSPSRTGCFG